MKIWNYLTDLKIKKFQKERKQKQQNKGEEE